MVRVSLAISPAPLGVPAPAGTHVSNRARLVDPAGTRSISTHLPCVVARLRRLGITSRHRVLLCDANSSDYVLTFLGLAALGCSIAVLDPDADPATAGSAAESVDAVIGTVPRFAHTPKGPRLLGTAASVGGTTSTDTTVAATSLQRWSRREDALILWSSGSTGAPKGLVKSGGGVLENAGRTALAMGYDQEDVFLPVLPLTHQYGLSIVLITALTGCGLIAASPARVAATRARMLGLGATVLDAAPSFYSDLLRRADDVALRRSLARVRLWCVGGAPLSPTLRGAIRRQFGVHLLDGYGMTETGNIALATPDDPLTVGRALAGVAVEIRDDAGSEIAAGGLGQVWVRTPDLYTADLQGRGPRTVDGWWDTGDLGRLDEHGRLEVLGRRRAVHRNGFTIVPSALEARAFEEGIAVQVVATDDPQLGCRLTACIEDPDEGEPAWWRERLQSCWARYELPDRTLVLPRWPRTASGKPDVAALTLLARRATSRSSRTDPKERR